MSSVDLTHNFQCRTQDAYSSREIDPVLIDHVKCMDEDKTQKAYGFSEHSRYFSDELVLCLFTVRHKIDAYNALRNYNNLNAAFKSRASNLWKRSSKINYFSGSLRLLQNAAQISLKVT